MFILTTLTTFWALIIQLPISFVTCNKNHSEEKSYSISNHQYLKNIIFNVSPHFFHLGYIFSLVFEKNRKTVKSDQQEPQNAVPQKVGVSAFYQMIRRLSSTLSCNKILVIDFFISHSLFQTNLPGRRLSSKIKRKIIICGETYFFT